MSTKSARPIYDDIKKSGEEITATRARVDKLTDELFQVSQDSIEQKIEGSKEVDIGTLKYVAKAFGVDMDTIVKWFTLAIVLVFDPLAVALILAYNSLIERKSNSGEIATIKKEIIKDENSENSPLVSSNSLENKGIRKSAIRKNLDRIINYRT